MRFSPGMTSSGAKPAEPNNAADSDPDSTELRPRPETGPPGSNAPQRTARPATDETSPSLPRVPADTTEGRFRVVVEQAAATVAATGEPAVLTVRVTNTSTIVDGYAVEAPEAPTWLIVESDEVQLLPGTEEALSVRMRVVSPTLVPAQQLRLVLSIRSTSQAPAHLDLPVLVTVPVLDVPVGLRAEPRLLRVRDRDTAACTVLVDNSRSNRPAKLQFSGSDPEQAVRFRFEPAALEVGPGASGSVQLTVTAAGPDPGQEISRILTVSALDGARTVETLITLQQARTVRVQDPPVTLEVVPSLVRVRDTTVGLARVVADNRGGTEWAHLELKASDPERLVRVTWASPQLHVPPGQTAQAEARFEAPLPDAGTEVSRTVTVTVMNGRQTSTATATFVQVAERFPDGDLGGPDRAERRTGSGCRWRDGSGHHRQSPRAVRPPRLPDRQRCRTRRPLHLLPTGGGPETRGGPVGRPPAGLVASAARSGVDPSVHRRRGRWPHDRRCFRLAGAGVVARGDRTADPPARPQCAAAAEPAPGTAHRGGRQPQRRPAGAGLPQG